MSLIINTALTVNDLPPPPLGKTGWPWTQGNTPLPERMPDGSQWPRISIVTPSYNYGKFIEETIRSVLLQGYPNLEYIIIDGGSTDNTVEIIKKYEKYLTYWVSEPDEGQTDAINKGYRHCTGDLFVWLNADDSYMQIALQGVVENYLQGYQLIAGRCLAIFENGEKQVVESMPTDFKRYLKFWFFGASFPQPAVFVAKTIADQCFPLDKSLYMLMDYQFFLRVLSQKPKTIYPSQTWVNFNLHGSNKCLSGYAGGISEFFHIAEAESKKLAFIERIIFVKSLKDYEIIQPLINSESSASARQLISALISRPTILQWPLLWKKMLRNTVGDRVYNAIKERLKKTRMNS